MFTHTDTDVFRRTGHCPGPCAMCDLIDALDAADDREEAES